MKQQKPAISATVSIVVLGMAIAGSDFQAEIRRLPGAEDIAFESVVIATSLAGVVAGLRSIEIPPDGEVCVAVTPAMPAGDAGQAWTSSVETRDGRNVRQKLRRFLTADESVCART